VCLSCCGMPSISAGNGRRPERPKTPPLALHFLETDCAILEAVQNSRNVLLDEVVIFIDEIDRHRLLPIPPTLAAPKHRTTSRTHSRSLVPSAGGLVAGGASLTVIVTSKMAASPFSLVTP